MREVYSSSPVFILHFRVVYRPNDAVIGYGQIPFMPSVALP